MSSKSDHDDFRQFLEFLFVDRKGQNYGGSYFSRLQRQSLVETLMRDVEPNEELLAIAREFAGSHAAAGGPTAVTDGPSTNEPKTGDIRPNDPENATGPTQWSRS